MIISNIFKWGIYMFFNSKNLFVISAALIAGSSLQARSQDIDARITEINNAFDKFEYAYYGCLSAFEQQLPEKKEVYFKISKQLKQLFVELKEDFPQFTYDVNELLNQINRFDLTIRDYKFGDYFIIELGY